MNRIATAAREALAKPSSRWSTTVVVCTISTWMRTASRSLRLYVNTSQMQKHLHRSQLLSEGASGHTTNSLRISRLRHKPMRKAISF
jgi:hypothetical protein